MQKLKRLAEAEVIAEFLKNEFHHPEFHADRELFESLVFRPDLNDERQNALRRELLCRRYADLWRELPGETQWWEVRIEPADLDLIRVAPRPEWKRIANGSMLLKDVAGRIRSGRFSGKSICKVQAIGYGLRQKVDHSSVVLIGIGEDKPLTIVDGNYRLAAALQTGDAAAAGQFRGIAGFSPRMSECYCYDGATINRWRRFSGWMKKLAVEENASLVEKSVV